MKNDTNKQGKTNIEPTRSPIITVLLFFNIVVSVISAVYTAIECITCGMDIIPTTRLIIDIITTTSLALLLNWKISGFYLYAVNALADIVIMTTVFRVYDPVLYSTRLILGVVILYAILQIKDCGISYWKAMRTK